MSDRIDHGLWGIAPDDHGPYIGSGPVWRPEAASLDAMEPPGREPAIRSRQSLATFR